MVELKLRWELFTSRHIAKQPLSHLTFVTVLGIVNNDMGYYTSYYTYGLPTFVVIVIALYLLFTGMCALCLHLDGLQLRPIC